MGWIDPRNLEHQRNRRLGPSAYRFAPGPSGVRMPDCLDRSAVRARAKTAEREAKARAAAEQEALAQEGEALRAANARVRIMLADVKFELALRALGRKYEGQPRTEIGRGYVRK